MPALEVNTVRTKIWGHFSVGSGTRGSGRRALEEVDQILNDALEHLGQQSPEFLQTYRQAAQSHRAIQQSNTVNDYLMKNYTDGFISKTAPMLFAGAADTAASGIKGLAKGAIETAKIASVALPVYKTGQVLWRVFTSPQLANHYSAVIGNASRSPISDYERKKQKKLVDENMRKLDNELFKLEMNDEIQ